MVSSDGTNRPDQQLPVGAETSAEEWADLHHSLTDLSQLATSRVALTDTLVSIAEFAIQAIPGAEGAGLTLLERDRPDTIVATAEFVSAVDDIQYRLGEGPCISAVGERIAVQSPALGRDSRWPRFGEEVARLGVLSALSLPLITQYGVLGAMNIYAQRTNAFTDSSVKLGAMFAVPAAIAVQNAQTLAEAQRYAAKLQQALTAKSSLDQAVGILMSRSGANAEEALNTLKTMSAGQHQKLHVTAKTIVDAAARRARANRKQQQLGPC